MDCSFSFFFGLEEPGVSVDCVDWEDGGAWGVGFMGCWARALGMAEASSSRRAETEEEGFVRRRPGKGRAATIGPASILGLHPRL